MKPKRCSRKLPWVAGLALVPLLIACAVRDATPDGITIVHNSLHPQFADFEARQHCSQFGKTAVLAEIMPVAPTVTTLFTRSSKSVFQCVEAAPATTP